MKNRNFNKLSVILMISIPLIFNSCMKLIDNEEQVVVNPVKMKLTVSEIYPGSFKVSWDSISYWYFVEIKNHDTIISSSFNGSVGRQDNYVKVNYNYANIKAGETYAVYVKATTSLVGSVKVGDGTVQITTTNLPTNIIGSWRNEYKEVMIFNNDGSLIDSSGVDYIKSWTIEENGLVIFNKKQYNLYSFKFNSPQDSLTLCHSLTKYTFTLSKK